jgi:NAD-dependent deacetylase
MEIPTCPDCGADLRPGVVWFGEAIPETASSESYTAASDCDVFLSIGTSSLVYPAAGLADLAKTNAASVVEVNPDPTAHAANFDFIIAGNSGLVMPKLIELLAVEPGLE